LAEITYSLKCGQLNSEEYYHDVRKFTDEVLSEAESLLMPVIREYISYLKSFNLENIREREEYLLELLSFGVLWSSYAHRSLPVRHAPFITLARMAEWRKKHQRIKPLVDFARGILITLFLLPENSDNQKAPVPTLDQVDHVYKWLEATGEFREQALRFILWRAFWAMKSPEELLEIFSLIDRFTDWFEQRSVEVLGKYTRNVPDFLQRSQKRYRWREDRISCTRSRLEYHLNMVGAELMNRAFRAGFNQTETKAVLVPGCMRAASPEYCQAKRVKEGLRCQGCLPHCRVNQLRIMGEKHGYQIYIIPHASDLSLWSPRPGQPHRGVIAPACVTTLVEGGWELKRYNVAAQCVLLDYSGCKKHWGCEGTTTALNVRELKRILNSENMN
jgi:hypothetical protein